MVDGLGRESKRDRERDTERDREREIAGTTHSP
jgi:hypothetical protein